MGHKPEKLGIQLDESGWTGAETLIAKMNHFRIPIDRDILEHIVETNNKKRFAFNEKRDKIRANQGHSINISLDYDPVEPPEVLFQGSAKKFMNRILRTGLEKRNRHHVHLSVEVHTAKAVGKGHGKPVVLAVAATQMCRDGFEFFVSANGVWLTENVPVKYLKIIN